MLVHAPGDGSKATSLSIPRDDYVDIPGRPDAQYKGKIKQVYDLAFDQKAKQLVNQCGTDHGQRKQQEREAGRKAKIDTVRQSLGDVPVNHFAEVTLVAFFQIVQTAHTVQPITLCVNESTQDTYSGADFHQGQQQINAAVPCAAKRWRSGCTSDRGCRQRHQPRWARHHRLARWSPRSTRRALPGPTCITSPGLLQHRG